MHFLQSLLVLRLHLEIYWQQRSTNILRLYTLIRKHWKYMFNDTLKLRVIKIRLMIDYNANLK